MSIFPFIQAASAIMGGVAAQREAELNAFEMETDKVWKDSIAVNYNNERINQYLIADSASVATFALTRDIGTDQSIDAFRRANKAIVGKDVRTTVVQREMESHREDTAIAMERRRGQMAMMSGVLQAVGYAAKGIYQYNDTRIGTIERPTASAVRRSPRPQPRVINTVYKSHHGLV